MLTDRRRHRVRSCIFASLLLSATVPWCQQEKVVTGKLAPIQKRADQGHPRDQFDLANAYMKGDGIQQDYTRAAFWYEKAAQNGFAAAQHQIGYLYSVGLGVSRDPVRACHWYQLAVASGVVPARVNLGVMYLYGNGVRQDIPQAKELFRQAAERGEGMGATFLGVLALKGIGGDPNLGAALDWFQRGVKLHDPIAYFHLGLFYHIYDPQHHPVAETIDLLRHSSESGYVPAKYSLASLLLKQPEPGRSSQEPIVLLQEASDAGDWKSTETLGDLALDGIHVDRDPARAFYYFQLSALQAGPSDRQALQSRIDTLAQTIPLDEQTRQTAQASDWFAAHHLSKLFFRSNEIVPALRASSSRPPLPSAHYTR